MNTPTPRTDYLLSDYVTVDQLIDHAREIETELTAVTEQRDRLLEQKEQWRLSSVCRELVEQRDKALQKIKNQAERIAYLEGATNHATGTPLSKAIKQRDRLADLVKQFISIIDITEESDGGRLFHPTNITSCRAGDLQKIGQLVEALRRASRDQPTEAMSELTAVTEERDEALSDLEFRRDLYSLQTKQLDNVREQRDRLAEALRKIKNAAGTYDDPYDEFDFIDWVTFDALQFLNKDHFPDVGNMIGTTTTEP